MSIYKGTHVGDTKPQIPVRDEHHNESSDTNKKVVQHVITRTHDEYMCSCGLVWGIDEEDPHDS